MEHIDRAVVSKAKTKKRIGRLVSTIRNEKIGKTFLLWTVGCQSRGYFGRDYLETWRYMIVWLSLLRASKRETQKKKKTEAEPFVLAMKILCIQFALQFRSLACVLSIHFGPCFVRCRRVFVLSRVSWIFSTLLPILDYNLYWHDAINQMCCAFCVA